MLPDFNPKSKTALGFGVAIFVMVTIRCIWLWQPQRQVELHQQHFVEAVGDRKWKKIDHFLADDFRDRFNHDKTWALKESREVLRQFFALTVHEEDTTLAFPTPERQEATVTSTLKIEGTGTPIAEYAKNMVNSSRHPFTFTWKQKSWKPWDWQLTSIDHPLMARGREDY